MFNGSYYFHVKQRVFGLIFHLVSVLILYKLVNNKPMSLLNKNVF